MRLTAAACAVGSIAAAAQALPGTTEGPGALLYSTHCSGCHTTQAHWRDGRLVTDWASLSAQVRRWQESGGLGWSDDDVAAVARYLNAAYYRFPVPETRAGGRAAPGLQRVASRGLAWTGLRSETRVVAATAMTAPGSALLNPGYASCDSAAD